MVMVYRPNGLIEFLHEKRLIFSEEAFLNSLRLACIELHQYINIVLKPPEKTNSNNN